MFACAVDALGVESGLHHSATAATPGIGALDGGEASVRVADLEIRPTSRQLLNGDGRVQLTGRELDVLMILVEQPDRVVTRDSIYRQVWGGQMPYRDRAVDVYVRRVREKLRSLTPEIVYIHTHFGIGYRFWPQSSAEVASIG